MHIFRRADSKSYYCWFYTPDKRRVTRSCQTTDRRVAEQKAKEWEREFSDPNHSATKATLGEAIKHFLREFRVKVNEGDRSEVTLKIHEEKIGHVARIFTPGFLLRDLSSDHVDRYIKQRLAEEVMKVTISKELVSLRMMLKFAIRGKLWSGNVAAVLPVGFSPNYQPRSRWLTFDELNRLLGELSDDRKARVAFIVATSARWGESERARRDHVMEFMTKLLMTKTERKTGQKERDVPAIIPQHVELLKLCLQHAKGVDGMLFTPWGKVNRDLKAACKRAKIDPVSPNDLRRSHAQHCRQAGFRLEHVAACLGHADTTMVSRVYGRLNGSNLADAIRATLPSSVAQG
jgi:integrase